MHIKSLSEGFFFFWICTLWPISITLAFNIARITNQVSPWVVLWLWKKQVLFPSTHMGNHYNMKYAHGDGQGGTGGECNNLRQNRGRAHGNQFIPTRQVEQTLGLPWKRWANQPLDMKTDRFYQFQKQNLHDLFRKEDFDAGLLQDKIQSAGLKRCCGHTHYDCAVFPCDLFWFIRTFTGVKIQPSPKPDPTKAQWSTKSTLKARKIFCFPRSTHSWELHITHHSLSWAGKPHPHSKLNPAVPIHLKDPCSFSRARFHLIIKKVNNIADLMESASSLRFIGRQ